jgi:hypothetical protein|tara:strand:+ start:418 stop:750 length:333 start_codon:yes stop_codon:yes gene_type:complete
MIDVKNYEGHTEGPWKATNEWVVDEDTSWGVTLSEKKLEDGRENRIGYHVLHKSDAQLIADAPKLLAEVRRLRKQLEDCKRQIQYTADWIRDRGEDTHAKELDEFLEWME